MDEKNWIEDGTVEAEPVTTETPSDDVEIVAEAEQPRDEHGRWVEAADSEAEPVDEPVADVATDEPVEAAAEAVGEAVETPAEEAARKIIEARLGEETFEVPEGLLWPQKRGDEIEYRPIEDILKEGMTGKDYSIKTTELAQMRREHQREVEEAMKREARIEAREKYLQEQESELKEAMTDPKKWAAYQEHLQQYQENEFYRKNVDRALEAREIEAERDVLRQSADQRLIAEASEAAFGWIEGLAEEFPTVDPERVAQLYGQALKAGQLPLDRSAVRQVYENEQGYAEKVTSPLQQELAELKATVERLQASEAAESHNAETQHAVSRAKAPKVTTGGGAPTKTPVKPGKFGPNELADRNQAWVNAG